MSEPKILELEKKIDDFIANEKVEEFTEKVNFSGGAAINSHFYKKGNMVFGYYQSNLKQHDNNEELFNIPEGYRPSVPQSFFPFVINNAQYGVIYISSNGKASINQLSAGSVNGRVYASFFYYIEEEWFDMIEAVMLGAVHTHTHTDIF